MLPESLYSWEVQKKNHHLSHISIQIVDMYNYTILPTTVKAMETFLEGILWKPFQLVRRILKDVSKISPVTGPEVPRGLKEVTFPRFRENSTGYW